MVDLVLVEFSHTEVPLFLRHLCSSICGVICSNFFCTERNAQNSDDSSFVFMCK